MWSTGHMTIYGCGHVTICGCGHVTICGCGHVTICGCGHVTICGCGHVTFMWVWSTVWYCLRQVTIFVCSQCKSRSTTGKTLTPIPLPLLSPIPSLPYLPSPSLPFSPPLIGCTFRAVWTNNACIHISSHIIIWNEDIWSHGGTRYIYTRLHPLIIFILYRRTVP